MALTGGRSSWVRRLNGSASGSILLLATQMSMATPASGAAIVLPEAGFIRAWSLTSPSEPDSPQTGNQTSVHETSANGVLDFNDQFKLHGPGSPTIVASGNLELAADVEGWLLVRADGWLTVTVDGQLKSRRQAPVLRARGWEAIPLSLKSGRHLVRLDCKRANDRWTLTAKFIANSGHSPEGALWRLPTAPSAAQNGLPPFDVSLELATRDPVGLRARVGTALGTPATLGNSLTIRLSKADGTESRQFNVGTWPTEANSNGAITVQLGLLSEWAKLLDKSENKLVLDVSSGSTRVRRKLNFPHELLQAWQSSVDIMRSLENGPAAPFDVPRASLELALRELSATASEGKSDFELHRAATKVQTLCDTLEHGQVPWLVPGKHELGVRASADASLQPFALYVPKPPENRTPLPLVIVLHGYNSTATRILDAFLDTLPDKPLRALDGFVLAPAAHGNTFYRGPGERDVLEILDWALQTLPVDKDRVTITGVSMGGTGTAEIALHYPDRFAAFAPLCGYHSYYVRRDTSGQPIRAWEKKLMHRDSAASSADSGRHLPMNLAHGLKDRPLENSRVLTSRYKALGYRITEDWPNLGHAVWKKTWAHAGLFPWLSQQTRVTDPAKITLSTTALRYAHDFWLTLTELESSAEISQIDAEAASNNEVRIKSKGVLGFELGDTRHIDRNRPIRFNIDGTEIAAAPQSKLNFRRADGVWKQAPAPDGRRKRLGAEGPWLDLWSDPLVFVFGSQNPATVGVNLEVARAFAVPEGGNDVAYPIISDTEFAATRPSGKTPIFVGNSADNALLQRWASQLPLSTDAQTIKFGGHEFKGNTVGAIYVYPHPENPLQVIGVITAPTPLGLWQSLSLPFLLPDFMVFDSRATPAGGEPILGRQARVLAAGFFENDWSLPSHLNDTIDDGP